MYSVQGYKCVCYGIIMYSFQKNKVCELTSSVFCSSLCLFRWNNYTITTLLHWAAEKGSHCIFMPDLIVRCYVTILAEIYGNPIFFGSGMGFVTRTQSDPGFVNPMRSGPGFVNPIRSNPIRSGHGFVNTQCYRLSILSIDYPGSVSITYLPVTGFFFRPVWTW